VAKLSKRIVKDADPTKVKPREHSKISIQFNINSSANDVEKFAISVLKKLIEDSMPPTPDNYRIYFGKLLDEKNIEFQKKIQELLEFEESNNDENRVEIEKDVKEIFIDINSIIKVVNTIYKSIRLIKQTSSEIRKEISNTDNPLVVKNNISTFDAKIAQIVSSVDKQLSMLQDKYQKAGKTFKTIENSTIFDTRFGVYNKRYFLEQSKKEREKIKKFNYQSTIVTIQVKDSVLKKLPLSKDKIFLLRFIAKMLLKTSRRNDIISYFGGNSFIMLLRHTDTKSTQRACERIHEMLANANIMLNNMEISINVNIGIAPLNKDVEIEGSINCALDAMEANDDAHIYKVCEKLNG